MRRLPVAAAVLLGALFMCPPAHGASPTEQLRGFFGKAARILDPESGEGVESRLGAIRAIVREMVDVRAAAQLSMGASWNARTAAEREEFVPLFAELLERALIGGIAGKIRFPDGLQVRYVGESVEGSVATVWTTIASRSGIDLPFTYRMIERAGRWAVRDVVIDGVSMAANYRAQFVRVIQSSSYEELVRQMRARVPEATVAAPTPTASADGAPVAAAPRDPDPPSAEEIPSAGSDARVRLDLDVTLIARALPAPSPVRRDEPAPGAGAEMAATPPGDASVPDMQPAPTPPVASEPASSAASRAVRRPEASESPDPAARPATNASRAVRRSETAIPAEPGLRPVASSAGTFPWSAPGTPPPPASRPALAVAPSLPAPGTPSPAPPGPAYWVQVGAFRSPEAARRLAAVLAEEEPPSSRSVVSSWAADLLVTRVRVGPFPDRWEAVAAAREMEARGHKPFIAPERE